VQLLVVVRRNYRSTSASQVIIQVLIALQCVATTSVASNNTSTNRKHTYYNSTASQAYILWLVEEQGILLIELKGHQGGPREILLIIHLYDCRNWAKRTIPMQAQSQQFDSGIDIKNPEMSQPCKR
jgi:hypothetical protein